MIIQKKLKMHVFKNQIAENEFDNNYGICINLSCFINSELFQQICYIIFFGSIGFRRIFGIF